MKISNFSKTQLRVATHITVMRNFQERVGKLELTHTKLALCYDAFVKALDKEDSDYKQQVGSDLTDQIREADNRRDRAWGNICTVANAFKAGFGTEAQTEAAQRLCRIIQTYKVNVNSQMDQETGVLRQAIADIEGQHIDLDSLSLATVFCELKQQNEAVYTLLNDRDNERAMQQTGAVKEDRARTDAAYDALVDCINALLLLSPTFAMETVAAQWNAVLNRIRVQALHASAQESETLEGVDLDGEEDGQQPDGSHPSTEGGSTPPGIVVVDPDGVYE